ncbi:BRO1 domain-containing protein [Heracleum sosnowskyi]|uniref:BRO1 domain-containing protein n=1 Tax=Heracleum sosnowskyi TaxID=360622 RepID=A0AAD8MJ43_9APIA|nr:BRO1 domain-containing protein [Heracleum sosnowskyi]
MPQRLANEVLLKDLVQSATLFRKAAGVYHSLAIEVLPHFQHVLPSERPPEATLNVSSVMSLICLAEAQAEAKGITGSLLAKLHFGIVQILDEASSTLHFANKDKKDISTGFLEFVSTCKAVHELRSYKYLAENVRTDSQIGFALGVLQHVQITTQKIKLPSKESWRSVLKQEVKKIVNIIPYQPLRWERPISFKL